ncbi:MAG: hypothetical protein IT362_00970 [Deltaproteobacteria bacterium]|nr:hypothetical protein [Deltaproteobacteria bacterium]
MMIWGVILLIINVALLGALLYILLFRKPVTRAQVKASGTPEELVKSINDGLNEVKSVARSLETRSADLSMYEKGLREKHAALEELIARTMSSVDARRVEGREQDVYARALNMLKSGVPSSEIARSLGLMSGETELLSALNRM